MYDKPIQHGEMVLKPVKRPTKKQYTSKQVVDTYIGAKSNQGHHHILQAKGMTVYTLPESTVVEVPAEGTITHQKVTDRHPDLQLPVGIYQVNIKTEYDIFDDVIKAVQD